MRTVLLPNTDVAGDVWQLAEDPALEPGGGFQKLGLEALRVNQGVSLSDINRRGRNHFDVLRGDRDMVSVLRRGRPLEQESIAAVRLEGEAVDLTRRHHGARSFLRVRRAPRRKIAGHRLTDRCVRPDGGVVFLNSRAD